MQNFRSQRECQLIAVNRNFILHETAIKLVGAVARDEKNRGIHLLRIARTQASAQPPEEVLVSGQGQVVQEIDVERVAGLSIGGLTPIRSVVIRLDLNVSPAAQISTPPAEKISSGHFGGLID